MLALVKTPERGWRRVHRYSGKGCLVDDRPIALEEIWADAQAQIGRKVDFASFIHWEDLTVPLPVKGIPCLAYALTYPGHRRETRLKHTFFFPKLDEAQLMQGKIPFRAYLDYEVEVGLLLRHGYPDRFGYCLLNDFTDRSIQVLERSMTLKRRQEVFSKAKSFAGSLLLGPLLVLGDEADWAELEATLSVNGVVRQVLKAKECLLSPRAVYDELLSVNQLQNWVLVATGTPAGVILTVPSWLKRLGLLLRGKLSLRQAGLLHLDAHSFLQPGDHIELKSDILGCSSSVVAANDLSPEGEQEKG